MCVNHNKTSDGIYSSTTTATDMYVCRKWWYVIINNDRYRYVCMSQVMVCDHQQRPLQMSWARRDNVVYEGRSNTISIINFVGWELVQSQEPCVQWSVLQCVAVCCSVLQCVAVCCSVLQSVAVCCSVLQRVAACCSASLQSLAEQNFTPCTDEYAHTCSLEQYRGVWDQERCMRSRKVYEIKK